MKYVAIIDIKTFEIIEMVKETDDSLSLMQQYIFNGRKAHRKMVDSKVHDYYLLQGGYPMYAKPIQGFGNDISGWTITID